MWKILIVGIGGPNNVKNIDLFSHDIVTLEVLQNYN